MTIVVAFNSKGNLKFVTDIMPMSMPMLMPKLPSDPQEGGESHRTAV